MSVVALIDKRTEIERNLRHLGLWQQGLRGATGPDPPSDRVIESCIDDAFPACRSVA